MQRNGYSASGLLHFATSLNAALKRSETDMLAVPPLKREVTRTNRHLLYTTCVETEDNLVSVNLQDDISAQSDDFPAVFLPIRPNSRFKI
ncbi:hypothetical protein XENORESO_018375 [Xenotaenia resolanae]|uniref:Uncharacterized protein n=1 Tax=Xenotaenia resolanae TaxID=208358 RepID=A0ABV0VZK4_9TELE